MISAMELAEPRTASRSGVLEFESPGLAADRGASIDSIARNEIVERRRYLLRLVRDLHQAVDGPRPRREALRLLARIGEAAEALYRLEDARLVARRDPCAGEHALQHRAILADLFSALESATRPDTHASLVDLVHATDAMLVHEFSELQAGDGLESPY